jgi:hypothetical protein
MTAEEILGVLRKTPDRLVAVTGAANPAQLRTSPEPDAWSATEILAHLRSCSDVWGDAIETIVANEQPTIRAVNPRTWIHRTGYRELEFRPSLQAFTAQRHALLSLLGQLEEKDWSRGATVLGGGKPLELTVHSYAGRLAYHERTHWKQLARTVASMMR